MHKTQFIGPLTVSAAATGIQKAIDNDAELSRSILEIARILVGSGAQPMTSESELELWVKHHRPVWKKDMLKMKQALANCYQEAEEKGLLQGNRSTKDTVNFLF